MNQQETEEALFNVCSRALAASSTDATQEAERQVTEIFKSPHALTSLLSILKNRPLSQQLATYVLILLRDFSAEIGKLNLDASKFFLAEIIQLFDKNEFGKPAKKLLSQILRNCITEDNPDVSSTQAILRSVFKEMLLKEVSSTDRLKSQNLSQKENLLRFFDAFYCSEGHSMGNEAFFLDFQLKVWDFIIELIMTLSTGQFGTDNQNSPSYRPNTSPIANTVPSSKALEKPERIKTEPKKLLNNILLKPLFFQTTSPTHNAHNPSVSPSPVVQKTQSFVVQSSRVASADSKHLFASYRPNLFTTAVQSQRDAKPVSVTPNVSSKSPLFNPLYKETSTIKRTHSESHFLTPVLGKSSNPLFRFQPPTLPFVHDTSVVQRDEERKARRIDQSSHCSFVNDPSTERNTSQVSHSPSITFQRHFSSHIPTQTSFTQLPNVTSSTYTSLFALATTKTLPRSNVIINHHDKRVNTSINENLKPMANRQGYQVTNKPIVMVN